MPPKRKAAPKSKAEATKKRGRALPDEAVEKLPNGTKAEEEEDEGPSVPAVSSVNTSERSAEEQKPAKRRRKDTAVSQLPDIDPIYKEAGRVFVCGQGDSGQLGLGNMNEDDDMGEVARPRHSPLTDSNPKVVQVAAGGMHSVALTEDGLVFTTGVNDEAALGRKTDTALYNSMEGEAGDPYKWGLVDIPLNQGTIVQVSAGDSHTVALTIRGAVYSWGVFRGNSGPYAFLPGMPFALKPVLVYSPESKATQVVRISSGADHVLALRRDGSVLTWGFGEQGQLGRLGSRMRNPEETMLQPGLLPLVKIDGLKDRKAHKAHSIAAGAFGSFIILQSGHIIASGVNASGQLGFTAKEGTVDDNLVTRPKLVASLEDRQIRAISAGKAHTLALCNDGRVYSFGLQTYGRLGREDADSSSDKPLEPGLVALPEELLNIVSSVAAGSDTSAVVTEAGDLYIFGLGTNKQLTRVSDDDAELPVKSRLDKYVGEQGVDCVYQASMGGQHTLLLVR